MIRFRPEDPSVITPTARAQRHQIASLDELDEIKAKCEEGLALCLTCDDGLTVVSLQPYGDELELFVWLAIAYRHGAFGRQESALRSLARDLGAKTIAFQTRRAGWARRLGPEWHRRGKTEFARQA